MINSISSQSLSSRPLEINGDIIDPLDLAADEHLNRNVSTLDSVMCNVRVNLGPVSIVHAPAVGQELFHITNMVPVLLDKSYHFRKVFWWRW